MKCKYHLRTEATERCPHCKVALCEECARPFVCLSCGKPRDEKAGKTSKDAASSKSPKKRRKTPPRHEKRIGPSLKGGRTLGWIVVCACFLFFGSWAWGNFSRLGQELDKHLKNQLALRKQLKDFSRLVEGKGGANDDLEAYLEKFDKKSRRKGQKDETEKLMAQLQGESAPAEEEGRNEPRMPGHVEAVLRRNAPKNTRIWKFSEHQISSRRLGYAVESSARWKVLITSPASGRRLAGTVTVCASMDAANSMSRAELRVDERVEAVTDRPPLRFDWATEGYDNGRHSLKILVYDASNGSHASSVRTVTVKN